VYVDRKVQLRLNGFRLRITDKDWACGETRAFIPFFFYFYFFAFLEYSAFLREGKSSNAILKNPFLAHYLL